MSMRGVQRTELMLQNCKTVIGATVQASSDPMTVGDLVGCRRFREVPDTLCS